jgi:hypothetical protein
MMTARSTMSARARALAPDVTASASGIIPTGSMIVNAVANAVAAKRKSIRLYIASRGAQNLS